MAGSRAPDGSRTGETADLRRDDGAEPGAVRGEEAGRGGRRDVGPILELDGVVKRYGATVGLDGVTLRVGRGERVALAGPSGAGKSTLLGLLGGSLAPTSGRARIFGHDPTRVSLRRLRDLQRRIGTIHQHFHLVDNLRVVHNVNAGNLGRWSLPRALLSLVRPRELERTTRLLRRVGIADKRFERTGDLSGGEQQRVALARVLAQEPEVILADEPVASLDRENSREVMELLAALSRDEGKTVVVSLHEVEYALRHCERVVGLREGRIVFDAPAVEVTEEMVDRLYRLER